MLFLSENASQNETSHGKFTRFYSEEEKGSYKFLHKDYLGSILAISDEEGNKLEQRHYDA